MGAHKDRLIQAAELLDMSPDALMTLLDSDAWGWQGDPRVDLDDDDLRHRDIARPAPEGFAVFAHWSASHDGVNVELDVPDGLRVTVHYNDALMIDQQVSEDGATARDYLTDPEDGEPARVSGMVGDPYSYGIGMARPDDEPDREPTPAQEEAWDAREDEARGHVLG